MRVSLAIFGLSVAVICTAVASQQSEPLAEQQFKNITSFKGQKASAVIPAMEFMSASLKVECDYCHVQDRSSDEKREKQTAREMIAMQKEINDKNFNGRTVVTCATCHGGHTRPVSVPPVTGLDVRTRRNPDVSTDQVMSAYAKAMSGDAAAVPAGIKLTGKMTTNGTTSPVEMTFAGGKFVRVTHAAQGEQKMGFDGTNAWFPGPNGAQKVPLVYALQYVRQAQLFLTPSDLPKQETPTGGTAKIDGKDVVVLTGSLAGGTSRASYYFDKQTGMLARVTYFYPTILGNIEQINDYSNYRSVGGSKVPMKIVNRSSEGDTTIEFDSGTPLKSVDSSVFEPGK